MSEKVKSPPKPRMNENKSVLVIDDDIPTLRMMRLLLETEGYSFQAAPDREQALLLLKGHLPSVVIMDYVMEGLAPSDFIHEAKAMGFSGPFLLCTAVHGDIDLDVDDVLFKPFDPDELPRKLSRLLGFSERRNTS
jgi:two-component system chemotaxis sensor kinase CheA